jgi:hypothetical protein
MICMAHVAVGKLREPVGCTIAHVVIDVRSGSFSTELGCLRHVRYSPDSDRIADIAGGPVRAKERTRSRGRGWRRSRAITSAAVTI